MRQRVRVIFALVTLSLVAIVAQSCTADLVHVQPREINDLLANPGMGWQTFHKFADEDPALVGLPSSTAYFRFYWKQIEPKEGEINWALFDDLLSRARKADQKLALRVMTAGTAGGYDFSPPWLREVLGLPGFEYRRYDRGSPHWVPDLNDPRVLSRHLRLIEALGERYDGHRDLALLDIGSVGLWGEWHMSGTGVDMPTTETRRKIIDAYLAAFRKTPLVMLINDLDGLKHATRRGAGWRADCWGDMRDFWNAHMRRRYPLQIEQAGVSDVWKRAPVALETCWDMRRWARDGWDIEYIFDWALAHHASYVNNKSSPIPEGTRPLIENLLRVLGYRFVLRSVEHPAEIARGQGLEVRMVCENIGVAPCYFDYRPALALADEKGNRRVVSLSKTTVRNWLPGKFDLVERIAVPSDLASGKYTLQIAIVEPSPCEPVVRLAIAGRRDDGWYPISRLDVGP